LRGKRRFERPRRGTDDQGRAARTRNGGTVGRLAGWIKAKRVELAPRASCPLSRKAERWPVAGWGDGRQPGRARFASCAKCAGDSSEWRFLPTEIPGSREPGLRLNPQLRRIPAEMPADLTSAEIAKSGSYFDDVTRDPLPYGIENTTDKVRRALFDEDATPCAPSVLSATRTKLWSRRARRPRNWPEPGISEVSTAGVLIATDMTWYIHRRDRTKHTTYPGLSPHPSPSAASAWASVTRTGFLVA
jgi:hypothetical protein